MHNPPSKHRLYASLLILGGAILLFRTIAMLAGDALSILVWWASGLLLMEMLVDVAVMLTSIRWWRKGSRETARLPLQLAAAATILHFIRVMIFVLGRTGPWINFDVQANQISRHADTWTWTGVYFAGIMATLGVIGMIIIWRLILRGRKKAETHQPEAISSL